MTEPIKVVVAGVGAFGQKHLDACKLIDGVEVVSVVGRQLAPTEEVARKYGVPHATTDLAEALARPGVDRGHPVHADAVACRADHAMPERRQARAGGDSARRLARRTRKPSPISRKRTGLVCMVGHTRRFNPSHQWVHRRIVAGEIAIQQMDVQTYFFRRTNMNALGQPRSWTDHLLWHHAAHTVDLFRYQTRSEIVRANAVQGPIHPTLGIAMDMSIQLQAASGAICTLSLSFNNDGPLGTFFRYICDHGTYIARYDELVDGKNNAIDVSKVDVSLNGIELQDREFFAAIRERREPNSSVAQVLPCYRTLHELEEQLRCH